MSSESSRVPSLDQLRAAAGAQGVEPADADLEAVQGFFATLLPALARIETRNETGLAPAGLFLPEREPC